MKKKLLKKKILLLRTNHKKKHKSLENKTKVFPKFCRCCLSLPVDAERKQLAVSSFAAHKVLLLFHFLVCILSFENCARCFCQLLCSRRTENGRNTFYSKSSSSS